MLQARASPDQLSLWREAHMRAVPRTLPRVLLIEDNPTQLHLYAMLLGDEVRVITATRGETGYALAISERPDAIIVDVVLPDVDGLDVCSRLLATQATKSIPLVAITGDDAAYARAKLMAGLDAVLKKPCPIPTLLRVIRHAVDRRRTR